MKKRIVLFIIFALAVIFLSIFFTLQYDIYSYHLWAYTAIKEGTHEVYNSAKYFTGACDYTHIGTYICLFQGKLLSYIKPLELASAPLLFFFKLLPLAFLMIFMSKHVLSDDKRKRIFGYVLALPFGISIIVNGQFDIIILMLLTMTVWEFEKKNVRSALFLSFITLLVKQTAVFFVGLILLHYFAKTENKSKYLKNTFVAGIVIFISVSLPFILKNNLLESIHGLLSNTFIYSSSQGYVFNIFSILYSIKPFEANYNIGGLSIATYSLIATFLLTLWIALIKGWDIYKKLALYSILWFNLLLGLREQHLLYPLYFISIFTFKTKKQLPFMMLYSAITIFNIVMFNPNLSQFVFKIPYPPIKVVSVLSFIQIVISLSAVVLILKEKQHVKKAAEVSSFTKREALQTIIFFLAMTIFAEFAPGFIRRNEKELFSDAMINKKLVDFSKDRYIDLNVITLSSFENYLGARMSDGSFLKIANNGGYSELTFDARMEYVDVGMVIINNDTFEISGILKNAKMDVKEADTIIIKSVSPKKFSQVALYNIRVK
ncbi:MAG: hypothetical protein PHW02_05970 [bacterium]|nr:hypothetical protein [bacterium]